MNVLKNMEIIFTVALALACAALYVNATSATGMRQAAPQERAASVDNTAAPMQVVVVSAKRLTEAEKKQSLIEERQAALLASAETRL